ncbi:DUF1573 domain-containing protein [Melioribacter sp. OK-6-Me]|uniref:DUF1573 domain-containing protein n=1 Tax=unclassified Melioribacter TaxID=2627329 RepID=UPI003ED928E0
MKRVINLFWLLLLFTGIIIAQEKAPKIFSPEPEFDFGEIIEGETVEHEFAIMNKGEGKLVIESVRASCGCTAAMPTKKELEAGESAKIKIKFDSRGRYGQQYKHVYVFSNDPENSYLKLTFRANVVAKLSNQNPESAPKIKLEKNIIDFGEIEEGSVKEATVKIKNAGKSKLEIRNIKSSCGCTAVLISNPVIEPGKEIGMKVKLDTKGREGELVRTVVLFTNDPDNPKQVITVSAKIIRKS